MQQTNNWWKTLFKGHLAPGLNDAKIDELTDERFLYFQQDQEKSYLHQRPDTSLECFHQENNHSL